MAKGDRRANPFGWLILGFLIGVVVTLLFLMFINGEAPAPSAPPEPEEAAVSAAPVAEPAPRPAPPPVAVEAAPPAPAPLSAEDAQIAEDAAASGMTARKPRP